VRAPPAVRPSFGRRLGRLDDLLSEGVEDALSDEGRVTHEHLEEDRAAGVDVASTIHGLSAGLLGRDVFRCPEDHPRAGERVSIVSALALGEAEVEHLDLVGGSAPVSEQHVAGLQVAMDDPLGMGLRKRRQRVPHNAHRLRRRHARDPLQPRTE